MISNGNRLPATARIVKKSDGVEYQADLLEPIGLRLRRMHEVAESTEPCFYIRHDVDHDLDLALAMAEFESRSGYFSTYFLLTPGSYAAEARNYYGWLEDGRIIHDPHLIEKCARFIDLGHDIGFHNDVVSLSLQTGRPPREILLTEIEFFAKNGIRLRGTAAHGNPLARELSYNNREIFAECVVRKKGRDRGRVVARDGRRVQLHSLSLAEFGFEYEAYQLPRDSRISESGTKWGGVIAGERLPKERFIKTFDIQEFRQIMSRARPEEGIRAMSVLVHPCHWRVV
jgi:hypothetical protein